MKFSKLSQLFLVSAIGLILATLLTACQLVTIDYVFVAAPRATRPAAPGRSTPTPSTPSPALCARPRPPSPPAEPARSLWPPPRTMPTSTSPTRATTRWSTSAIADHGVLDRRRTPSPWPAAPGVARRQRRRHLSLRGFRHHFGHADRVFAQLRHHRLRGGHRSLSRFPAIPATPWFPPASPCWPTTAPSTLPPTTSPPTTPAEAPPATPIPAGSSASPSAPAALYRRSPAAPIRQASSPRPLPPIPPTASSTSPTIASNELIGYTVLSSDVAQFMVNGPFKTGNEPSSITLDPRGIYIYAQQLPRFVGLGLRHLPVHRHALRVVNANGSRHPTPLTPQPVVDRRRSCAGPLRLHRQLSGQLRLRLPPRSRYRRSVANPGNALSHRRQSYRVDRRSARQPRLPRFRPISSRSRSMRTKAQPPRLGFLFSAFGCASRCRTAPFSTAELAACPLVPAP